MNQLCKVCSEPAAGFHFGAFTCEGCKSFFGRTYNNLSQINECKNGGQCIINKQNRTSCKACRLRKCLFVGMSKTGSRYGRRSNWFKIHCLLQEQASFSNSQVPFRSPVTPTLQDGALPFVSGIGRPLGAPGSEGTNCDMIGLNSPEKEQGPVISSESDASTRVSSTSGNYPLTSGEHHLQSSLNPLNLHSSSQSTSSPSSADGIYTEHVYEAFRRSQNIVVSNGISELESFKRIHDLHPLESMRRKSSDMDSRSNFLSVLEWNRRLRESCNKSEAESLATRKPSPKETPPPSVVELSSSSMFQEGDSGNEMSNETLPHSNKSAEVPKLPNTCQHASFGRMEPRDASSGGLDAEFTKYSLAEQERIAFFKSSTRDSSRSSLSAPSPLRPNNLPPQGNRIGTRDDLFYTSINNNIFHFPAYHPFWPPLFPFPLMKYYPPFIPGAFPGTLPVDDCFSGPPFIPKGEPRTHPYSPKEDPDTKKRFLDAVLQVQRENGGEQSPEKSPEMPATLNSPSPVDLVPVSMEEVTMEQPMDLTVKRKRKLNKSEIMFKPIEKNEEEMKREKEEEKEIKGDGVSPQCSADIQFESPLKLIKLENASDALVV